MSTSKRTSPGHSETTGSHARGPLLEAHRFLRRGPVSEEGWSQLVAKDRDWERSYRERWQHDKVVRSTHGVNCTGSCSWNVYVKEGIDHVGVPGGGLSLDGSGDAGVRAAGLPARGVVLVVHVFAAAAELSVCAGEPDRDVPRGAGAARRSRSTPGRRSSDDPERAAALQARAWEGRVRARLVGGGDRVDRGGARAHDQALRAGSGGGVLADPGDVDGLLRGRDALSVVDRRGDPVVL